MSTQVSMAWNGEPPQRVAADVAETCDLHIRAGDLCQCRIHVAVAATLAQCGRTGYDDAAGGEGRVRGEPQGRARCPSRSPVRGSSPDMRPRI